MKTGPESRHPHFQPWWRLTIRRNRGWWCILHFLQSTDQDRVSSWELCFSQTHVTELCTGTTVKQKDSWYSQDRWDDIKSPSSYELRIEETQIVYWISQISEWPLETTRALICMCSHYDYTFKLGKQFHLHFCTWPSVLQGLKISPSTFYYTSYWNLRTFSCGLPFPSPVSFCISQRILGLDPNGGREPELAHFPMHGNVDSPSCHEYRVDELHPWQASS